MAAPDDDLLNPDEIEALLNAAAGGGGAPKPAASKPPANESALLDPSEIEALLAQSTAAARESKPAAPKTAPPAQKPPAAASKPAASVPKPAARPPADVLLESAEANLAAAVSPNLDRPRPSAPTNAKPYQFESFEPASQGGAGDLGIQALQDVELDLCIELGRTELLIEEVLQLREGSVVPLDKLAGDPVDILVNGRLIARGEVLVLNDNFCVRIAEILAPQL